MTRSASTFSIATALLLCSQFANAASSEYGSLSHHEQLPNVLILTGEINAGDSFELRRAMRNHDIRLVVTASAGGNLYEGLQIAAILHDNDISTYIPEGANCESSCANVFLGGQKRMALGEIGVHQFYSRSDAAADKVRGDVATSSTQYTTSEIIGILNEFDTPPFVYEKMFGTTGMHYFKGSEKQRLSRGGSDPDFLNLMSEVDALIATSPVVLLRPPRSTEPAAPRKSTESGRPMPAPPTPEPLDVDRFFSNVDFFGMDLDSRGLKNVSLEQCENHCRQTPACAAYSYVTSTRWCWPKSGVNNISMATGVISGITDYSRVNAGIFDRPFKETTKTDILGYDLYPKGLRNMSLEQCRHACLATSNCVAFSWVSKQNWCFPKYGVGNLTETWGIISGVRQ